MASRSSILIVILVFVVLFSVLYLSLLTGKPVRSLKEPIRPKISQIQALDIVLADAKRLDARVNDLRLFVNQYNFSSSDFEEHPEHYKGSAYRYSFVNDVRKHPELLHLQTMYLHPNGTRYLVDPINGSFIQYNDPTGTLSRYCLNGSSCDRSTYNTFANKLIYFVDAGTSPVDVFNYLSGAWVDADTGEIVWGNIQYEQSLARLPSHVQIYDNYTAARTIKQLLNPSGNTTIVIVYDAGSASQEDHFVPRLSLGYVGLSNKVVWKNEDYAVHTVTSDNGYSNRYTGKFGSGLIQPGHLYEHTFMDFGRYDYHCEIHPYMKGTLMIQEDFR